MSSTALDVLNSLEWRLRRVEFWLHGGNAQESSDGDPEGSLNTRLERLQRTIDELGHKSQAASSLLDLSGRLPEVFKASPVVADSDELRTSTGYKTSIILSSASQFPATVTQLTSMRDNELPRGDDLATLISLQPRLEAAQQVQAVQDAEVRSLRDRSAALLAEWYEKYLLQDGEDWAEFEQRMRTIEQGVRRVERERNQDSNHD